ncbi:MAG: hypothetical protein AAGE59_16300 [Cyanobacteria bacterium P01_F01_bin.86]
MSWNRGDEGLANFHAMSRYRLIDDGFGQRFHLGQNMALKMLRNQQ